MDAVLDYAMKFLREDGERFVWVENAREGLAALIDVIYTLDTDPAPLLDDLLRLAAALETELRSPEAATLLMAVLGTDKRVIETFSRDESKEKKELARRWSGSEEVKEAQMYGAAAPIGSITAGALREQRVTHRPVRV